MLNPFTDHPHSVGESYFAHMKNALMFGVILLIAGFFCIIHAILPFMFKNTTTNCVAKLVDKINKGKRGEMFSDKLKRCAEKI
ncbi:DUF6356 family protein [Thiotrichales bacterium 19S9-12]|nr:DUF6356 family protein [Thiotrichales bacterium 19S9-11]MCF6811124.1 DUF6356 family protein [Thiotrichales bacterium 19S9-12]